MIYLMIFAFGIVVGSFLNVCIYRVPRERSIVTPRSACPGCGQPIAFYDNIPILSFLILRGRCRRCSTAISWQYPVVEALNGLLWVAAYLGWALTPSALLYAAFGSAMLVLVFIDAQHRILPHGITVGGWIVGLATAPWQAIHQYEAPNVGRLLGLLGVMTADERILAWIGSLVGSLLGAGMLLVVAVGYYLVRREEGMGHGDIILMGLVGAVLGWGRTLLTVFLGSLLGAVVGLVLIRWAGGDRKYEIPFGTFLGIAAVSALFFGEILLDWYWSLL
ncbi:MAG TPA: prepilin peptidase [Acidobacteriota bacterium]|nr:prepilin peptidase [Acidobacteriota bacterium]HQG90260.1 prepilin peptidase [Acidobacteriota bacterium]